MPPRQDPDSPVSATVIWSLQNFPTPFMAPAATPFHGCCYHEAYIGKPLPASISGFNASCLCAGHQSTWASLPLPFLVLPLLYWSRSMSVCLPFHLANTITYSLNNYICFLMGLPSASTRAPFPSILECQDGGNHHASPLYPFPIMLEIKKSIFPMANQKGPFRPCLCIWPHAPYAVTTTFPDRSLV